MKILAIESSCDETAAAVVEDGRRVCSNIVASQVEEHRLYGGVVPEIASRRHCEAVVGVTNEALKEAGLRDKVKVMVGGAPVTQAFADEIGADAYTPDAASAAEKARSYFA